MAKKQETAGAEAPAALTLEQATAKIAALELENKAANDTIKALSVAGEELEKSSKETSEKLQKLLDEANAELEDAAKVVEDLKAQLKDADAGTSKGAIVTIGKEKYKVVGGTMIAKKPYSAADIAADTKLAQKLLEKGSKLFKKIS